MKQQDPTYEDFLEAAKHYADKIGPVKIAKKYPCNKSHIYQVINKDKGAGNIVRIKFAKACGFNSVKEFVDSVKNQTTSAKYVIETNDTETWEHFQTVKRFKNKDAALKFNQKLADIEEEDTMLFIRVISELNCYIERARQEAAGLKRPTGTGK